MDLAGVSHPAKFSDVILESAVAMLDERMRDYELDPLAPRVMRWVVHLFKRVGE